MDLIPEQDPPGVIEEVPVPGRARQTLAKTFLSLRNRNYRLFFIGQSISNTGNWLTNVALTLLVLSLTHLSGIAIGLLAACQYGPILLFSAWAGTFVDRLNKRRFLLLTQSLEMAQSVCLAVLAFMKHPPLVALYGVAIMGGMFLAFDNPLRRSFVSEMVPREDLPNAIVLYTTIVNVSRIFGPALAGLLVVTAGFGWCFTVDAASYVAVITGILMMRVSELHLREPKPQAKHAVWEAVRYIASVPTLWISFVMLTVIGTISYNFTVTLPLFVTSALHQNDTVYTVLYSVFSLGAVICSLWVAQRSLVYLRHLLLGALALGSAMFFLAISPNVPVALAAVFFVGISSILYMTATTTIVQLVGKPEIQGRVLALQSSIMIGSNAFGGVLMGWLADTLGARSPLLLGGAVSVVAAGFGYLLTRRYARDQRLGLG